MMALIGWVRNCASLNHACDAMKTAITELSTEVTALGVLNTQEEALFLEEEAAWQKVAKCQDAILARADSVMKAKERMIAVLAEEESDHSKRLEIVQKIIQVVLDFENLDYKAFETDRKELLETLRSLEALIGKLKHLHAGSDECVKLTR